ncbi:hypothetical protein BJY00DRAFT_199079 [Aspergillus carlsbadensis]|nr:hypothetical protein BJY00DRAFT_199079 [Aspergillus carlsbadensis]
MKIDETACFAMFCDGSVTSLPSTSHSISLSEPPGEFHAQQWILFLRMTARGELIPTQDLVYWPCLFLAKVICSIVLAHSCIRNNPMSTTQFD